MNLQQAILSTLAYHDIFDYPLTLEEIIKFSVKKTSQKQVKTTLKTQKNKIQNNNLYYYLTGRNNIVATRIARKKHSIQKLRIAQFYKNILKLIPSVKLVAITGALAVENSTKKDDIDLLIITTEHSLWSTRLLANLLLWPWKRSPNSRVQSGKACLNIFLDESNLRIKDENLYTAHEIAQIKVIYNKQNTHQKFTEANKWVTNYLPNWVSEGSPGKKTVESIKTHSTRKLNKTLNFLEELSKQVQLNYMKSKQTTERIGDTQLFFHPKDTQKYVLNRYQKKLRSMKY